MLIAISIFAVSMLLLARLSFQPGFMTFSFTSTFTSGLGRIFGGLIDRLRQEKLQRARRDELPGMCDLLVSSLRGGASFRSALQTLHQSYRGKALQESIAMLNEAIRLGVSQEEALGRWAESLRVKEADFFVFCVNIAQRTGGRLADSIEQLADTLREQIAVQLKADALTSQGRLQALLMAAMPVFLLLTLSVIDQSFVRFFVTTSTGIALLALVFFLEILGLLWISRIVRIEV